VYIPTKFPAQPILRKGFTLALLRHTDKRMYNSKSNSIGNPSSHWISQLDHSQ